MPSGLSVLMGLAKQPGSSGNIPQQSQDDYALDEMIPDEALYSAQDEIGQAGAASGRAYAIPSREALRGSGRSALRRMFGEYDAKGRAASEPQRVAGEYGVQQEMVKQRGARDVAEFEAQSMADLRELQHAQAMERQSAGFDAAQSRVQMQQAGQDKRSAAKEQAIAHRQQVSALLAQAKQIEAQAQKSWPGWMGGSKNTLMEKAAELRQRAQAGVASMPVGDEDGMEFDPTNPEDRAMLMAMLQGQ